MEVYIRGFNQTVGDSSNVASDMSNGIRKREGGDCHSVIDP
jgi:hypothetical protein